MNSIIQSSTLLRDNSNVETLFNTVFRNKYLNRIIKNKLLQDRIIEIRAKDLNNSIKCEYLSTISLQDKLDYNISIKLVIKNNM